MKKKTKKKKRKENKFIKLEKKLQNNTVLSTLAIGQDM